MKSKDIGLIIIKCYESGFGIVWSVMSRAYHTMPNKVLAPSTSPIMASLVIALVLIRQNQYHDANYHQILVMLTPPYFRDN